MTTPNHESSQSFHNQALLSDLPNNSVMINQIGYILNKHPIDLNKMKIHAVKSLLESGLVNITSKYNRIHDSQPRRALGLFLEKKRTESVERAAKERAERNQKLTEAVVPTPKLWLQRDGYPMIA